MNLTTAAVTAVLDLPLAVSSWLLAYPLYALGAFLAFWVLFAAASLEHGLRERRRSAAKRPAAAGLRVRADKPAGQNA